MKPLLLPACLAAVAPSAAGLKDPAQVAADWNRVVDETRTPLVGTGTLAEQIASKPPMKFVPFRFGPGSNGPTRGDAPAFGPLPPDTPLYDAPN